MRALNRLFIRLGNAVGRRHGDRRFREEMESHLAAQTEENIRAGMTPEEARRQARLKLGSMGAVREEYQSEKSLPLLENLLLDLRYAVRVLRRSPAFTAVALVTLMLGIGANVVVFGVLNAVLLHPLDVREPQDLYQLRPKQRVSGRLLTTSYPAFEDLRRRSSSFNDMFAVNGYSRAELRGRGNLLLEVGGEEVSANFFDMLGVQPAAGQFFHAADDHGAGSAPYVVLSNDLWRNAFQADRGIVGTTVEMNLHPFTVVGVAPAQFHGTEKFRWPDYWIPLANETQLSGYDYLEDRASRLTVIGRLKPGVTAQQATENLNAIVAELAKEYPATDKGLAVRLIHPGLMGDDGEVISGFLWSVSALALLVLFAACANLATLFAARAADRTRELALRVALGSSRRRLVRQLLTEAMVVSLAGGAAGLMGAYLLLGMLGRWRPSFGGHLAITVDARVYLAGLALTLGSALLFGMVPARQAWQSSPLQSMKSEPVSTAHLRRFALRDVLLGAQIAICTLLVIASLVAVRGMLGALDGPLGFKPEGAMLAETDLGHVEAGNDAVLEKEKAMMEATRSLPAVTAVGMTNATPLGGGGSKGIPVYWPGTTEFTLDKSALETRLYDISPGYLEAAGTRLLGGRDVSWQDTSKTPAVAIVNATFARTMWGQAPATGQRFILSGKLTEVVGVAEDGKYHDLAESPQPVVYLPLSQSEDSSVVYVVRSHLSPNQTAAQLRSTLGGMEPGAPLTIETWRDALEVVLFPARTATLALGVMGLLAAMLAVTGLFGMAAYSVSRRMKELGIRAALGARRVQVMSAAVGRPMVVLGMGSAVGLLSGVFATRLLERIVYQANPRDPMVLGGAAFTMALLGVVASAIPARRALAVDPSKLMREE
jgi:predicted permease